LKFSLFSLVFFSLLLLQGCFFEEPKKELISKGLSPKEIFFEARQFVSEGSIDEAIVAFDRLQAAYPASKYSIQAKLEIVYALYKNEKYDEALNRLNEYIKLLPSHFTTPYAYYMRGLISENKSKSIIDEFFTDNAQRDISSVKDSMNYYLALVDKFPNSEYSDEVKTKMISLRNILSRHELFVAIFYTKKEAHIAAINRCKYIIEKFPNTPSVPAALHLIAHNYDKINEPILAIDARRVLKNSYPNYIPHYTLDD